MNVEKLSISLPSEVVTMLIVIQSRLMRQGCRVSRSAVISACITKVYEAMMIEENKEKE